MSRLVKSRPAGIAAGGSISRQVPGRRSSSPLPAAGVIAAAGVCTVFGCSVYAAPGGVIAGSVAGDLAPPLPSR